MKVIGHVPLEEHQAQLTDSNTIFQTAAASVVQDSHADTLTYRVMSSNGICLFQDSSPTKAINYAEWFAEKSASTRGK